MFPPPSFGLDIEAISGICGSISIACWVVVFSPQIVENFRRSSAEGLSVEFVVLWLLGDFFNILGGVMQGVLTTMIILAVYYTIADVVLLGQCFYYRGFTLRDPRPDSSANVPQGEHSEQSPLLANNSTSNPNPTHANASNIEHGTRNRSSSAFRRRLESLDGTHLSPVTPLHPKPKNAPDSHNLTPKQPRGWIQTIFVNTTVIVLVVLAGIAGYYLSSSPGGRNRTSDTSNDKPDSLKFNVWGQVFGYICAALYLGSRIPQLLLNYRRKSTEGLNVLFFLFACIGNLAYVCSIFAFEPKCFRDEHGHLGRLHCNSGEAGAVYGHYILVNLSWLFGSLGTLFLDLGVFAQFWIYRSRDDTQSSGNGAISTDQSVERGRVLSER